MNINELENLKVQLLNDEVDPFKVGSKLFENETKAWNTEEWKDVREEKLKDKCSQCGSVEGLRLQHTWTPRHYSSIKRDILSRYKELIREEHPIDSIVEDYEVEAYFNRMYPQEIKEICPKCKSTNLRKRKTVQPIYFCQRCNYEFDVAESKLVPELIDDRDGIEISTSDKSFRSIQKVLAKEPYYQLIQEKYGVKLEKEVLIAVIDESINYLRGEDTITLCKRCGFALSQGKNLCPKCKSKYKSIYWKTCNECR